MHARTDRIEDFDILQNVALGANALWAFVNEYYDVTLQTRGVPLPLLMPVLPLVFHAQSVKDLGQRHLSGGLYRGLADNKSLPAGLQSRMENMADLSLDALMTALASGLLRYESTTASLVPARKTMPTELKNDSVRLLIGTAKRLGHWFAELPTEQVVALLKIRF